MTTIINVMSRRVLIGGIGRVFGYGCAPRHHLFHSTALKPKNQPYLLADIGEGITECRVIQWFVKPGDKVNEFDALCEVQSDKASVEITSRYNGTITTIYPREDDMAKVGQVWAINETIFKESCLRKTSATFGHRRGRCRRRWTSGPCERAPTEEQPFEDTSSSSVATEADKTLSRTSSSYENNSGQVLPAVRRMIKEHGLDLRSIPATGKGGRVMKADVQRYLASQRTESKESTSMSQTTPLAADTVLPLSPTENQMFKVMTDALSIPHFGFTHLVDMSTVESIRRKCNAQMELVGQLRGKPATKITTLPIIMKALSMVFQAHPKLNSHLETAGVNQKPQLVLKGSHNFGVAVDTPNGLLVPVVKDVQNRSVMSIAEEIKHLSLLAKEGALKPHHLTGATFTVSNIGSIGGTVVSPIIVPPMVGIVAVGKIEDVPVLVKDDADRIENRRKAVLSWSADHRVLDGASIARCASLVSTIIEEMDGVGFALM